MPNSRGPGGMTLYDHEAWVAVEQWRQKKLSRRARKLIPARLRDGVQSVGRNAKDRFDALPKAEQFELLFLSAIGGAVDFGSRVATATIREGRILEAFRERGHDVGELCDINELALSDIDKVKPNLALSYTTAATLEGAAAGFAISGGEIVAAGGTVLEPAQARPLASAPSSRSWQQTRPRCFWQQTARSRTRPPTTATTSTSSVNLHSALTACGSAQPRLPKLRPRSSS